MKKSFAMLLTVLLCFSFAVPVLAASAPAALDEASLSDAYISFSEQLADKGISASTSLENFVAGCEEWNGNSIQEYIDSRITYETELAARREAIINDNLQRASGSFLPMLLCLVFGMIILVFSLHRKAISSVEIKKTFHRFRAAAVVYGVIWALSVIVFWLFCRSPRMAMLVDFLVQIVVLPAVTFILSFFIGIRQLPGKYIWTVPILFSIKYMLCKLATLSLLEFVLGGAAALPTIYDFIAVSFIAAVGLLSGRALSKLRKISARQIIG